MTTTTRTMRKAPWAAVLTALLAVLALVFGVLTVAAPAGADQPDNPGNSQDAPGHNKEDGTPGNSEDAPGQNKDDEAPGNSGTAPGQNDGVNVKKIAICHADANNGNGQPNLGKDGEGGNAGVGFNLIYISKSGWENGHEGSYKRHPSDYPASATEIAQGHCGTTPTSYETVSLCVALTGTSDYADTLFTGVAGTDQSTWENAGRPLSAFTIDDTKCGVAPKLAELCELATNTMKTFDDPSEAYTAALADANAGGTTWAFKCPGTDGGNPDEPLTTTAVEGATVETPEGVAVPAPGTVEEPAKVAVPAPATVPARATVPAGDGSSVPTAPTYVLALLALGATALAAATVRLVKVPSR